MVHDVNEADPEPTLAREGINIHDINLDEVSTPGDVSLTEGDRLQFAKQVLTGVMLVVVLACASYAAAPDNKALQQIFELIKIGALPIVTLLITFYFPNGKR